MTDKKLIEEWLAILSLRISTKSKWALFEPKKEFYEKLETGAEEDLADAEAEICAHWGLDTIPSVTYQWGITIDSDAAGQILQKSGTMQNSHIDIPLFYVGKPYALGAIIAHELTHHLLYKERLVLQDNLKNEQFTDLASIAVGLGKLVLNGTFTEHLETSREYFVLGYLSSELKAYAYQQVNAQHGISKTDALTCLNSEAIRILESAK